MRHAAYERRQVLWLMWILLPMTTAGALASLSVGADRTAIVVVALTVLLQVGLLLCLGRFVVQVGEGRIAWRFGFVGWPRWSLGLDEVAAATPTRTGWLDGWGIRRTRRGMLYNAQGFGAVRLDLHDGRHVLLGSDEPDRLAAFIAARLPARG